MSPRSLVSLVLVTNLLFAGFVSVTHVHEHGDECCSWPAEEAPVSQCACGHDHAPEPANEDAPSTPPHDHDDCHVCQVIATAWLSPTVVAVVEVPTLLSPIDAEPFESPRPTPLASVRPRGPPAVA